MLSSRASFFFFPYVCIESFIFDICMYMCVYIYVYIYIYIYISIIFLFCSNSGGVSAILLDEFSRPYFVASRFDPFAFSNFSPPNDVDISLEISALRSRIVSRIVFNQYAIVRDCTSERTKRSSVV